MSEMLRFWGPVAVVAASIFLVTMLLMKKFKKRGIYKYIPTLVMWIVSILLFVYAMLFAQPMQDLGYLVMALITGMATFIALIITIIVDVIRKKRSLK